MSTKQEPARYELSITRTFAAPRELVWKAWTDPEMAKHWMGPRGFQAMEFHTPSVLGAAWSLNMKGHAAGTNNPVSLHQSGKVLEIDPPRLLSYTFAWDNRSDAGLGNSPFKENVVTVRFEEQGDKTVMHFTQAPFASAGERDGHSGGWNSSFDRFAEFMLSYSSAPSRQLAPGELHLKRFIAAPRTLIFRAWMQPELLAEWWGPEGFTNPVCEIEPRSGGSIRIKMQAPDGTTHPMTGRFAEVYPPYRFHFTSSPLDARGEPVFEIWNSVFLQEKDDGTEVVLDTHLVRATPEAGPYLQGMSVGWDQSLGRLQRLAEEMTLEHFS